MKLLASVALSVVLSLGAFLGLVHTFPHPAKSYTELRQATYLLRGEFGSCSAVAIAPNKALSAAHCADAGPVLTLEGKPAKVVKIDPENDLLLLEVEGLTCPCVPVATRMPTIDSEVVVVGFPFGAGEIVTTGLMSDLFTIRADEFPQFKGRLMLTAEVDPGNSGGPVFQVQDGKWVVIGIVTNGAPHHTIAPGVDKIQAFLK